MRKPRALFEQALVEKTQRLWEKIEKKQKIKQAKKVEKNKKGFAKYYKMSYNELRQEAKKMNVKTWRKSKEELIEELIAEHKRLH
jgi:hypothetical protein